MRSDVEIYILDMIQSGDSFGDSVGDACNGVLYVDLSFERNAPTTIEDARGLFGSKGIDADDEACEQLAELFTPIVLQPKGTPSRVYLIASLDDAGFVNWGTFATATDHAKAWASCVEHGRMFETVED